MSPDPKVARGEALMAEWAVADAVNAVFDDDLDPAKGIVIGSLIGAVMWAGIALAAYWWIHR